MYIEQLTKKHIEFFRQHTPLKVEDKIVPFKIFCNNICYEDPRGKSQYAVFLDDFSCKATFAYEDTKRILQQHYVNFMSQLFEDYMENYEKNRNTKNEQSV